MIICFEINLLNISDKSSLFFLLVISLLLNIVFVVIYFTKKTKKSGETKTKETDEKTELYPNDIGNNKNISQTLNSLGNYKKGDDYIGSILYAKHIQNAMFPPIDKINRIIPENFILYRPKNIISGDYYWATQLDDKVLVAVADCTGHGVPGAMMSMLGIAFLNEITHKNVRRKNSRNISASEILNLLNEKIQKTLHQTGKDGEARDGMDIALCIIDYKNLTLEYSGAYNPIYIFRDSTHADENVKDKLGVGEKVVVRDKYKRVEKSNDYELIMLHPDKMPIGIHYERKLFTSKKLNIKNGDIVYMFSDGFADQFGGEKGRKFSSRKFRLLLAEIYTQPLGRQKEILDLTIDKWKGKLEQVDDVLIMGIKLMKPGGIKDVYIYDWSKKTILLAEDDDISYRYINEVLSKTKVKLLWAKNGKEALDILHKNPDIDMLLTDIHMPILNGYELIKRARTTYPNLKVIVQAAYRMSDGKEKSYEAGCDDYIAKPISPKELLSKIDKYIR